MNDEPLAAAAPRAVGPHVPTMPDTGPHPTGIPGIPPGHDIVAMTAVDGRLFLATAKMLYIFDRKTDAFRPVTFRKADGRDQDKL